MLQNFSVECLINFLLLKDKFETTVCFDNAKSDKQDFDMSFMLVQKS
jgi:hypothetical protein